MESISSTAAMTSSDAKELIKSIQALNETMKNTANIANKIGDASAVQKSTLTKKMSRLTQDESKNKKVSRIGQVPVFIRVVFLRIGEIDTIKEKFAADVFIQAKWREPTLDGRTDLDPDAVDWGLYWNPELFVENEFGEAKETVWHALSFDDEGKCTVIEKRRLNGSFLEYLELNEFPFDTQDLTITVSSEKGEGQVVLEEDHHAICGINVQSFVDEQEWRLHTHVETWKKNTTKVYQNQKHKHPALSAACKASRRAGFFIWNIFFVMFFICSLAFSTFAVNVSLPQNRLQLSFILLLTTVTFKFVVNQTLPRISYLTYLDKYILTSMSILCCVCVWHSLVHLIETYMDKDTAVLADRIVLLLLGTLYVGFHILFSLWVYCRASKTSWKISLKDEEHKERIEKLQESGLDDITQSQTNLSKQISRKSSLATSNGNRAIDKFTARVDPIGNENV